jgi:quercetin dioxygenase-like cupin family protein
MTMESKVFLKGNEMNWEELGGGVSRQIMGYNTQIMMVKVKFKKDSLGSSHHHFHSQTTYVASGKFEFSIGDEKMTIIEGDAVYIKPNIIHSALCIEEGILIDVFSPVREEFLDGSVISYFGDKKK